MHAQQLRRRRAVCERWAGMTIRSRRETITFKHPFRINGVDRLLSTGAYEVITDDEMIEGLSFEVFRRVATVIMVPAAATRSTAMEMRATISFDLAGAECVEALPPSEGLVDRPPQS